MNASSCKSYFRRNAQGNGLSTTTDMLPRFLFPFLVYRDFFFPFLVLSSIVGPCWLVFRLYRLRTPGQRLSFRHELLLLTFVVYLSGLAVATLSPSHPSRAVADATVAIDLHPSLGSLVCSSADLPEGSAARAFCVRNARGNVILFFPLGILIPLVWRRLRFWRGIQIAIALSITIELVQCLSRTWGSYRTADINDVVLNVVGAGLGLALVFLVRSSRSR
jgi:glycopeptide antibiotics resistance protein